MHMHWIRKNKDVNRQTNYKPSSLLAKICMLTTWNSRLTLSGSQRMNQTMSVEL